MINSLHILIILVFIFSSCSDFSGNEDAVEASLKPAPVTRTNNNNDDDDDTPHGHIMIWKGLHMEIILLLLSVKVGLCVTPQIME